jgi:hypothetical protein
MGPQGEPGRGMQADWDQNDSSAEDYVKNRPFYIMPGLIDVSVPMEAVSTPSGTMYISPRFTEVARYRGFYLVKDIDYLVTYDDVEYNCKAFEFTTLDVKSVAIGNPELVAMGVSGTVVPGGAGTDAPFAILGGTEFRSFDGETHYVTIAPGVVKLPNEYLDTDYIKETARAGANDIVCTASGEVVAVNDSAERSLRGLTLYGKTVQNGTPSPDNPVPLESVGADGTMNVTVSGKNLFGFGVTAQDRTTEYREVAYQRLIVEPVGEGLNSLKYTFNNGNWSVAYICLDGIDGTKDYAYSWKVTNNTTTYSPYIRKDTVYSDESRLMLVI